jgi:DNA-directed RNA polymerase subunit M/transcription elongation factor TFIIS
MREKLIELLMVGHQQKVDEICGKYENCDGCPYSEAISCTREITVDHLIANGVTVQQHAKNLEGRNSSLFKCSLCGWWDNDTWSAVDEYIFCPGCGAKMDAPKDGE